MTDNSIDDPLRYNPTNPPEKIYLRVGEQTLIVDGKRLAAAAEVAGADVYDVLSIGAYRNHEGTLVPDYTSVRIERKADE